MHGDELGAVGKSRLDLDVVDHRGDAVHHLIGGDHMRARLHQLGHGAAVARALDDEIGDERHRLGMIELHAAFEPPARDDAAIATSSLSFSLGVRFYAIPRGLAAHASNMQSLDGPRKAEGYPRRSTLARFSIPHCAIAAITGLSVSPSSVRRYSVRGGVWPKSRRSTRPLCASSLSSFDKMRSLICGQRRLSSEKRSVPSRISAQTMRGFQRPPRTREVKATGQGVSTEAR